MMGCRQAREAVETATRREMVGEETARHLAGCTPCDQYAKETFGLMALLGAQPRVEAPADFDFRLRARLARARDTELNSRESALRAFWTRTFSLPQATAALALIMFAAGAAALYLRPADQAGTQSPMVAVGVTPTPAETKIQAEGNLPPTPPVTLRAEINGSRVIRTGTGSGRAVRPGLVSMREPATAGPETTFAGAQEVLIYQPGATRSVVVPRRGQVIWGAQLVGLQRAAAPRSSTPATVETF